MNISARVVALKFDNDETSEFVERDKIGTFRCSIKRVALFCYNQEIFAEHAGILVNPLLQVVSLLEPKHGKIRFLNFTQCLRVDINTK